MRIFWTPLTIFYQDLSKNDISVDDETMSFVAKVIKHFWIGSKPIPKITPILTPDDETEPKPHIK